jgi:hypothetical protein
VTPYLTQHSPPALVATLPPIVDHGALAGSGGYHRPCSAQAVRRWSLTTPGSTTASRSRVLISLIAVIASVDTTTLCSIAFAPPDSPVPAPRGTTGAPSRRHTRTTCRTSSAVRGRTTAAGVSYGAHSASSWT